MCDLMITHTMVVDATGTLMMFTPECVCILIVSRMSWDQTNTVVTAVICKWHVLRPTTLCIAPSLKLECRLAICLLMTSVEHRWRGLESTTGP